MTPTPSSPAAMGMDKTASIVPSPRAARWECPELVAEEATTPLRARVERGPRPPYRSRVSTPGKPLPRSGPRSGDMDIHDDMGLGPDADPCGSGGPLDCAPPGPPCRGPPGGPQGGGQPC